MLAHSFAVRPGQLPARRQHGQVAADCRRRHTHPHGQVLDAGEAVRQRQPQDLLAAVLGPGAAHQRASCAFRATRAG